MTVWDVENIVQVLILSFSTLLGLFGLFDALLRPASAFVVAEKLTKPGWVLLLAVCVLCSVLTLSGPLQALLQSLVLGPPQIFGLFGLIGLIGAGVYAVDVRPAVAAVTRR